MLSQQNKKFKAIFHSLSVQMAPLLEICAKLLLKMQNSPFKAFQSTWHIPSLGHIPIVTIKLLVLEKNNNRERKYDSRGWRSPQGY